MSPSLFFSGLSRRTLLSAVATLSAFPGTLLPVTASAQTITSDGPLPSWNDGAAKQAILNFVAAVTREGSPDFVPPAERIATFDNDGTLWVEQPGSTQLTFALDRVKALAPLHPEWKDTQPFKAVLENDMGTLAKTGEKGLAELVMASHSGMTTNEFQKIVTDWLATARHPRFKRPYTELAYQPMIELLAYLRSNGFKTFIVFECSGPSSFSIQKLRNLFSTGNFGKRSKSCQTKSGGI
jgi:haloacid dehalogenase-like hydrolase